MHSAYVDPGHDFPTILNMSPLTISAIVPYLVDLPRPLAGEHDGPQLGGRGELDALPVAHPVLRRVPDADVGGVGRVHQLIIKKTLY